MTECDRCEHDRPNQYIEVVSLDSDYLLCESCREGLETDIENYYWYDRYTDDHHESVMEIIEGIDEINCAHDGWPAAVDLVIHTDYVSSAIVTDLCDYFGLEIVSFGPRWEADDHWNECTDEHGSMFEITLDYGSDSPVPSPPDVKVPLNGLDWLDGNDKQF